MSRREMDIYFSYAHQDVDAVRLFRPIFEQLGWSVFLAEDETYPSDHVADVLYAIRTQCRCVVVVWTQHSVASEWCREEARDAKAMGDLVQVCLDESPLPTIFLDLAAIMLAGWRGDPLDPRLASLIAAISDHLSRSPSKGASPEATDSADDLESVHTAAMAEGLAMASNVGHADTVGKIHAVETPAASTESPTARGGETLRSKSSGSVKGRKVKRLLRGLLTGVVVMAVVLLGWGIYAQTRLWARQPTAENFNLDPQSLGPEMVVIPAGRFIMGSPDGEAGRGADEGPQHEVVIARPFALSRYEVTFEEYDVFAQATKRELPDDEGWGRGRRPVINVTWNDAQAYAAWLSEKTHKTYRLPTEAEWEFAARAGTTISRYWGDDSKQACLYANVDDTTHDCEDGYGRNTAPVGSFQANKFGLQDMLGNVWEWVEDCWHDNYKGAPTDGSAWVEKDCGARVLRGGSWDGEPNNVRAAVRNRYGPDGRGNSRGFRLARTLN